MKLKKTRVILLAAAAAGVMATGGIMAYFTDADTVTNTFTVGKISLDLQEPGWDPENGKNLTPGETVTKDPKIENDGTNPAFVFAEVIVPYARAVTADTNGNKNEAADIELFSYGLNEGWTELGEAKWNEADHTVTHRYVYGSAEVCRELAAGDMTPALFENVKFANIVEGTLPEETVQQIVVNAYGIQTTDVDGGKSAPDEIWAVLAAQQPQTEVSEAEDPKTDKKQ